MQYIYIFYGQLIIQMILYFVYKVIRWFFLKFVVPFYCVTWSHPIYTAVSRYFVISLVPAPATTFEVKSYWWGREPDYGVISFSETPLNLTISFVYIFSHEFKHWISSELNGYFCIVQLIC